jgi:hypothetical protein
MPPAPQAHRPTDGDRHTEPGAALALPALLGPRLRFLLASPCATRQTESVTQWATRHIARGGRKKKEKKTKTANVRTYYVLYLAWNLFRV